MNAVQFHMYAMCNKIIVRGCAFYSACLINLFLCFNYIVKERKMECVREIEWWGLCEREREREIEHAMNANIIMMK